MLANTTHFALQSLPSATIKFSNCPCPSVTLDSPGFHPLLAVKFFGCLSVTEKTWPNPVSLRLVSSSSTRTLLTYPFTFFLYVSLQSLESGWGRAGGRVPARWGSLPGPVVFQKTSCGWWLVAAGTSIILLIYQFPPSPPTLIKPYP